MLTPVDLTNKIFKGGIGYDKKDVEAFMVELSTDYRELYSANIELKDKIATLNESLQHYRSVEDSMTKAMTLSEKTAEEIVAAAHDKARQIQIEAELKAEALLKETKDELQKTKDDIYRLQQQHAAFKLQFTQVLEAQKILMEDEMPDIDLGASFEPSAGMFGSFSGGNAGSDTGFSGGLGGGLGSGTYVGSNDSGRERANQEPAFDRGSLNMDPFADAANGGGRFSRQTGGAYTGANKKKSTTSQSAPNIKPTKASNTTTSSKVEPEEKQIQDEPTTQTVSREEVLAALKAAEENAKPTYSGEVENRVNEYTMLESKDNETEGFNFIVDDEEDIDIPTIFNQNLG